MREEKTHYLFYENWMVLHLNKLKSHSPIAPNLVEIGPVVLEKKIFNFINVFLKRAGLFNWTNLNPLHTGNHCAKFGWNWPSGSGEDFQNLSMYFCYLLIQGEGGFIWKKIESSSNLNPLHSRMHCAKFIWNLVWLKSWLQQQR